MSYARSGNPAGPNANGPVDPCNEVPGKLRDEVAREREAKDAALRAKITSDRAKVKRGQYTGNQ